MVHPISLGSPKSHLPAAGVREDLRVQSLRRTIALVAILVGAAWVWSAPRSQVPVPGPDADPEAVVHAYIEALNERDYGTVNAIDATGDPDLGRFSRAGGFERAGDMRLNYEGRTAHVTFLAEYSGSQGRDWWGYYLERNDDGRWQIVGGGVA